MFRLLALGIALSCVFFVGANKVESVGAATFDDEYFGEFEGPLTKPAPPAPKNANAGNIVSESHDGIVVTREGAISSVALDRSR